MSHEFLDFVEDFFDGMHKAEELLDGVSYSQFKSDLRINFAVVRTLEIMGEATKRLPKESLIVRTANSDRARDDNGKSVFQFG
jgi:uncharacterized protein with HEPN domain